ncbi:hypothetical protein [Massilia pseudoviolaceinigra]|uniref:hypothetical protein n=1 Tax=Massilia pseudoviolaceinigra TaxID=3057165 RepID=UPI002796CE89|nr:hypothetical protein [Massilia sp. CCM 9206]MDQ1923102.1 hypothetical protein [Massilia sp. CCM 9206]
MRYKSSRPAPVSLTRNVLAIALIIVLFWGPIAVYCSWSIYFTQPSIWLGLAAAGMGLVLLALPMMRTARRDIETGTHASLPRGTRFSWVTYLAMLGITGLIFYGWMTSALWIVALLMSPPLVEREFRVGATHECTGRKCNSCRYRAATLLRFESTDTDIMRRRGAARPAPGRADDRARLFSPAGNSNRLRAACSRRDACSLVYFRALNKASNCVLSA